jgi:hypothetical protein
VAALFVGRNWNRPKIIFISADAKGPKGSAKRHKLRYERLGKAGKRIPGLAIRIRFAAADIRFVLSRILLFTNEIPTPTDRILYRRK